MGGGIGQARETSLPFDSPSVSSPLGRRRILERALIALVKKVKIMSKFPPVMGHSLLFVFSASLFNI